jgi:rubrerythrin
MKDTSLNTSHVTELLYQALETEKGGVQIYTTALRCASNEDLKKEWTKYLEQTKTHVQVVSDLLKGEISIRKPKHQDERSSVTSETHSCRRWRWLCVALTSQRLRSLPRMRDLS